MHTRPLGTLQVMPPIENAQEHIVKQILEFKDDQAKGRMMFKIRWEGHGAAADTWEPIESLDGPLTYPWRSQAHFATCKAALAREGRSIKHVSS